MKVTIQLDCEQISRLVYKDLRETRDQFLEDMDGHPAIFSINKIHDKMIIQKHIEALDLILGWYQDPAE
jgi:hypothetical protein